MFVVAVYLFIHNESTRNNNIPEATSALAGTPLYDNPMPVVVKTHSSRNEATLFPFRFLKNEIMEREGPHLPRPNSNTILNVQKPSWASKRSGLHRWVSHHKTKKQPKKYAATFLRPTAPAEVVHEHKAFGDLCNVLRVCVLRAANAVLPSEHLENMNSTNLDRRGKEDDHYPI